jgi:uncharacterized repeat protein (TIGR01451 family)
VTKSIFLRGCATSAIALGSLMANPAYATGTASGTVITNNVTVSYQVGTTPQTDATATNNITVDRKVDLTVLRVDTTATSVTPGTSSQAVTFRIENISNATLDFALNAVQVASGSPAGFSGADSFDVTGPFTYRLDDGDNVLDAGDTTITHLNALAPNAPVVVHVVAAIPLGLANGAIAGVTLTATAKENDNGALIGSNLTQAATNTAGVDTIFADGIGATDGNRDAAMSITDDYVVLTANLSATKTSTVVAGDFGTGAAIPGATVQYCISVTNTGGVAASSVAISDTLPVQVTYDATYGVKVGGANCTTPGAVAGSYASGVVTGPIGTLNAATTQTVIFRATIN